jgi:putative thioredoxin
MPEAGRLQDHDIGRVIDATETTFEDVVVERSRDRPVVVDFWAAWCAPCRSLGPVLEREVEALDGAVELVKVDVDANQSLAQRFGIRGIPAVKVFRDGHVVDEFVGALPPPAVQSFLERLATAPAAQRVAADLRARGELPEVAQALEEGSVERALELLLASVEEADPDGRERIRELMVELFRDLGAEHPLAVTYRRRLATALY